MHIIPAPDLNIVRQLLQPAGLPIEDIGDNPLARFYLIEMDGKTAGVAGVELHATDALLRSLMVRPEYRGRGLAAQLVSHIQQAAAAQGAMALYLLTTDAAEYFKRLGFFAIARDAAPDSIRRTREFTHLCPDNATLLCRIL